MTTARTWKPARFLCQDGLTLVECLISLVISSIVLSGLVHVLNVALTGYQATGRNHGPRMQAHVVMQRIARNVDMATPKSGALSTKPENTSGDWFYGVTPSGQQRKITYTWSAANSVLNEIDDSNTPVAILANVRHFSVTSPSNTDPKLVTVSLTVGQPDDQATLNETLRLGGTW